MTEPTFKLSRVSGAPVSDDELIADLQQVAQSLNSGTVSQKKYGALGTFDYSTVTRRFGSWDTALRLAGLSLSNEIDIPDERLFENLLVLWQHLGQQPRRSELSSPPSTISQTPYNRRFGSWTAALEAFVNYANGSGVESPVVQPEAATTRHPTGRDPSLRLRGMCFNVTALPVVPAAQVLPSLPALNFTLTYSPVEQRRRNGSGKSANPLLGMQPWKIQRTYGLANHSSIRFVARNCLDLLVPVASHEETKGSAVFPRR